MFLKFSNQWNKVLLRKTNSSAIKYIIKNILIVQGKMHIYHLHKNSFCFTEAIFDKYAFFINLSKRLEPADHGKSNQELNLIKTTTLERKTPNTVCCANSIELYYIMMVVLVAWFCVYKVGWPNDTFPVDLWHRWMEFISMWMQQHHKAGSIFSFFNTGFSTA